MPTATIKQSYSEIPAGAKLFAKKVIVLFAAWGLLYYFIMQPTRVPDKRLTNITANITASTLSKFYKPGFTGQDIQINADNELKSGTGIMYNNNLALFIGDACNAFDLYVLYIAFLVCLPTTLKRVLLFSIVGVAGIFVLNIARCFMLVWLIINKPSLVDFMHHYLFTLVVYSCIFAGWVAYSKKYTSNNRAKA